MIRPMLLLLAMLVLPVSAADEPIKYRPAPARADDGRPGGVAEALLARKAGQVTRNDGERLYFVSFEERPAVLAFEGFSQEARKGAKPLAKFTRTADIEQYRSRIEKTQQELLSAGQELTGQDIDVVTRHSLLLNGVSAFMSAKSAERLRSMSGIAGVEPIYWGQLETDRGATFIGSPTVWNGSDGGLATQGEGVIIGIIDTGIDPHHRSFADVGDDGYDHANPLGSGNYLGACASSEFSDLCNDKLIGIVGYPEITSNYPPYAPAVGIDYIGHGTHVASIAAGNRLDNVPIYESIEGEETPFRFASISGVAPHANIVSYQICQTPVDGEGRETEGGACLVNYTVDALEHAIEHGVSVINYSIGNYPDDPWTAMDSQAFLNARLAGIHIATSAGNNGPFPETVGGPANSPWITSVAASTHDRQFTGKTLGGFSGGDLAPPAVMPGKGITPGHAGPIVMAISADPFNELCDRPFAPASFTADDIVVCKRGNNSRIDKGRNVRDGGAGGMILVNNHDFPLFNDVVDDPHVLPAIHLSFADSDRLLGWLASGTGHRAEITAAVHEGGGDLADIVTWFSSRGPNYPYAEFPAIHVSAPGAGIYAAYTFDAFLNDDENEFPAPFAFQSGTSMSSPHVAGAYALLHARHPDWSPAQAQSALMMTAEPDMRMEIPVDAFTLRIIDADVQAEGSGSIRVNRAVNAGLLLDIEEQEYRDADPSKGGKLRDLNFPALFHIECVAYCSWERSFDAVAAANWQVEMEVDDPDVMLSVDQPMFATSPGDKVALAITASDTLVRSSTKMDGRLWLTPDRPDLPRQQMPVRVEFISGTAPKRLTLDVGRSSGVFDIPGVRTLGTDGLEVEVFGLASPASHTASIPPDPTPDVLYDHMDEWHWVEVMATEQTRVISARISEWKAPDLDLFVVSDTDGDGKPDLVEFDSEYSCISGSPASDEECVLTNIRAGRYFVGVHNYTGTGAATDEHTLEIVMLDDTAYDNIEIWSSGGRAVGETFTLSGSWHQQLEKGQRAFALVSMSADPSVREPFAETLLDFRRVDDDVRYVPTIARAQVGGTFNGEVVIAANRGEGERNYSIAVNIPAGMEPGTMDAGITRSGDQLLVNLVQLPGSDERRLALAFDVASNARTGAYDFEVHSELEDHGVTLPTEISSTRVSVYKPYSPKSGGGGAFYFLLPLLFIALYRTSYRRSKE